MKLFGSSGIRGRVHERITPDFCVTIGKALGTTLPVNSKVCIATDTRLSRDYIKTALTSGLLSVGINVTDLDILPTPALALLTRESGYNTGIMVTASHNPPEYNGIKLFNDTAMGYSRTQEEEIEKIYYSDSTRAVDWKNCGTLTIDKEAKQKYFNLIKKIAPTVNKNLKVVVDPGNGAASKFVSELLIELGYTVFAINDEPNGLFPNRRSEPDESSLIETIKFLKNKNADLAVCYDGDADRVVFCDREGFLGYNEMITFISGLLLKNTHNQKIVTTVETGRLLDRALDSLDVEVIRGCVGDVNVACLTNECKAMIGVEEVGVYIIPQVGYYPESIFATLLLLSEIDSIDTIRETFKKWPEFHFGKLKIDCCDEAKSKVMDAIARSALPFKAQEINRLDGLRYEFHDAWLLIRASGTEPAIRILAEATSKDRMEQLLSQSDRMVKQIVFETEISI